MTRVAVKPELLRWAMQRAELDVESLSGRFPKLEAWEIGEVSPTLNQLESFARVTHVPVGFLFLDAPPHESMPIPDFRLMGGIRPGHPSPDLLDTIYACQQRQEWYHDYARQHGEKPLSFIGAATVDDDVIQVASNIRRAIGFDLQERRAMPTWQDAMRRFIQQVETIGVLVMISGIVGGNTRRKLDPEEFRGFTLVDELAPLIFINGADTRAAQMFTLAHELAHVWLGQSGVSDVQAATIITDKKNERWCNAVAAEILAPIDRVRELYQADVEFQEELHRLARMFKISTLVILRRLFDAGFIDRETLRGFYRQEMSRLRKKGFIRLKRTFA